MFLHRVPSSDRSGQVLKLDLRKDAGSYYYRCSVVSPKHGDQVVHTPPEGGPYTYLPDNKYIFTLSLLNPPRSSDLFIHSSSEHLPGPQQLRQQVRKSIRGFVRRNTVRSKYLMYALQSFSLMQGARWF